MNLVIRISRDFWIIKEKLGEYPILKSPDFALQFIVSTDASHTALGATLS